MHWSVPHAQVPTRRSTPSKVGLGSRLGDVSKPSNTAIGEGGALLPPFSRVSKSWKSQCFWLIMVYMSGHYAVAQLDSVTRSTVHPRKTHLDKSDSNTYIRNPHGYRCVTWGHEDGRCNADRKICRSHVVFLLVIVDCVQMANKALE